MLPYLASAQWWISRAEGNPQQTDRRHLMRCSILGADRLPLLLSVPVVGGASALKHSNPDSWVISDHDHWNLKHRHALETAYSRTPYFAHFYPALETLLATPPMMASELCERCGRWVFDALDYDNLKEELREYKIASPHRAESMREYILKQTLPHLSIADALFRVGKDLIFLL